MPNDTNSFSNKRHPEKQAGEVFLINCEDAYFREEIPWKSKRRGKVAYDVNGKELDGCFPVFVKASELVQTDPKLLIRLE